MAGFDDYFDERVVRSARPRADDNEDTLDDIVARLGLAPAGLWW